MRSIIPQQNPRMPSQEIAALQEALILLGFDLAGAEAEAHSFGESTKNAVRDFLATQ